MDHLINHITKVANIHIDKLSDELKKQLVGRHYFLDAQSTGRQHIYSAAMVLSLDESENDKSEKLSKGCAFELKIIEEILNDSGCAYFRIVN